MHPLHPAAAAPGGPAQQFAPDAASALFLPVRGAGGVLAVCLLVLGHGVAAWWSICGEFWRLLFMHHCSALSSPRPTPPLPSPPLPSPLQEAGHFLLLACTRAALACALTPDGRLHMLHVFLPPHNTPAGCSPYAAWRLSSGGRDKGTGGSGGQLAPVVVTLAVAWQHSVSAYSATLLQRRAQQAQQAQQPATPPAPLPPPALLRSWVVGPRGAPSRAGSSGSLSSAGVGDTGICGCCFLDSGPLVRSAGAL